MSETLVTPPPAQDEEKVRAIAAHMRGVIEILGLDTADPNLFETPERVAKLYLEMFGGLAEGAEPDIKFFPNDEHYKAMVIEKDIPFYSPWTGGGVTRVSLMRRESSRSVSRCRGRRGCRSQRCPGSSRPCR